MQNHPTQLVVGATVILISFLLMALFSPERRISAVGLVGSAMHLAGVVRWQIFFKNSLLLDFSGVALMSIAAIFILKNSIIRMKRRAA